MARKPAPYQSHSLTSREAAMSVETLVETLRERVLRAIRDTPGGLTAQEVSKVTGIAGDTVRPRIVELSRAGTIRVWGSRRTESGRRADVWTTLAPEGANK